MSRTSTSPFSLRTVLALVVFGSIAFLALLYFIGAGDTERQGNDGRSHAASNGLNGYSAFAKLLELKGFDVNLSRSPSGLDTYDLLILTPPTFTDAEEIGDILEKRENLGPTIVILPKWYATRFPENLPKKVADKLERKPEEGWVVLQGTAAPDWTADLPEPYAFDTTGHNEGGSKRLSWSGMGLNGKLPEPQSQVASQTSEHETLATDSGGGVLALSVLGEEDSDYYNNAHWTIFIVEPDLVNNYGMAQPANAEFAMAIVEYVANGDAYSVTFDLTQSGFGGETNLLTLAFTPPFLAATLCLLLALIVVGWRAFMRFGPAIVQEPAIAFGKQRLIANGAGLILRARRYRLLAEPYVSLVARRLQARLGLTRADAGAIDLAMQRRMPDEEPFSLRAATLRRARRPSEILAAAAALKDIERKLKQ